MFAISMHGPRQEAVGVSWPLRDRSTIVLLSITRRDRSSEAHFRVKDGA